MVIGPSEDGIQMWIEVEGIKCRAKDSACVKRQVEALKARSEKRRKALTDMSRPMHRASIYLDQWVQKNFKAEGGLTDHKWPKSRRAEKQHGMTLQNTGRLRASFLPFASKNNAGIGSDLPYAKDHEESLHGLPVRRMLPKQSEVKDQIKKILGGYVDEVLQK